MGLSTKGLKDTCSVALFVARIFLYFDLIVHEWTILYAT